MESSLHLARAMLTVVLSIMLMAACSGNQGPTSQQIEAFVRAQLPGDLTLIEIKSQNFADKSKDGIGRASISGTVTLAVDRVVPLQTAFHDDLVAAGFTPSEVNFFAPRGGFPIAYVPSEMAGTKYPFTAEIAYEATVDGFRFHGLPHFNLVGQRADNMQFLKGTPSYNTILQEATALRAAWLRREADSRSELERFFSARDGYVYVGIEDWNRNIYLDRFQMTLEGPLQFEKKSANQLVFSITGYAIWITEGSWANSRFKAGERTPLLLAGEIVGAQDQIRSNAPLVTRLLINVPNAGGAFYNTSDYLYLSGQEFIRMAGVSGRVGGKLVLRK